MARSIEVIFNEMVAEKQTFSELNGLLPLYDLSAPANDNPFASLLAEVNNRSKVAVWKMWLYLVATGIYIHELLWDNTKEEMTTIAANAVVGNPAWYAAEVKKWQYGDALFWNSTTLRYQYADSTSNAAAAKRLAKRVAAEEVINSGFAGVVVKVAKLNGTTLEPLDNTVGSELDSLVNYVSKIKPAGVDSRVISLPPDQARLHMKVYYDGTLVLNDFKTVVEAALNQFFKDIDFSGKLQVNELVDAIQGITGTLEPWCFIYSLECKADAEPTWTPVPETYNPASGYFELVAVGTIVNVDTVIEYVAV
jgi:hypothetical protein